MLRDDLAYPAMLVRLPPGLLGLVATSLVASYMSTISTMLNWGSSYVVNDLWLRFVRPEADGRELVRLGRATTAVLMVLAGVVALQLQSVYEGFQILLKIGAGTGLIYILRWFWWRLNAAAEIAAMVISFGLAIGFFAIGRLAPDLSPPDWLQFLVIVFATTAGWLLVALVTRPESEATLRDFYRQTRPGGPGWRAVLTRAHNDGELRDCDGSWNLRGELTFMAAGCASIYGALFAGGLALYGRPLASGIAVLVAILAALVLAATWRGVASGPSISTEASSNAQSPAARPSEPLP